MSWWNDIVNDVSHAEHTVSHDVHKVSHVIESNPIVKAVEHDTKTVSHDVSHAEHTVSHDVHKVSHVIESNPIVKYVEHGVSDVKHDVSHDVKTVEKNPFVKDIEKDYKSTVKDTQIVKKDISKGLMNMGGNLHKDIVRGLKWQDRESEKIGTDVKNVFENAGHDIEGGASTLYNDVKHEFTSIGKDTAKAVIHKGASYSAEKVLEMAGLGVGAMFLPFFL